jgi:hypothetical protein
MVQAVTAVFKFDNKSRMALDPTNPTVYVVEESKCPDSDADKSNPTSVELTNIQGFTCIPPLCPFSTEFTYYSYNFYEEMFCGLMNSNQIHNLVFFILQISLIG